MATRSREKSAARKANADKRPRAIAKYVRISSRKVKVVIDLIRGKSVAEAKAILAFTPKAASEPVLKVLNSAVANAENNLDMSADQLFVAEGTSLRCLLIRDPPLSVSAPVPRAVRAGSASAPAT